MATGILLKRPSAPKSPFQPPSYGINRLPPSEPLDPEKFVGLGLDLSTRAREQIAKACELFQRLDEFARINRNNLSNEDVVNILTDLREEAEAELERGFYAFDVATEVLTRVGRHGPSFGEIITRKDRERWKSYFHSLRGVLARAYVGIYDMVLAAPTCGDLSHIPPQLHFSDPGLVMKRRYDRRQGMAVVAGHEEGKEYWRRRLVKGVESGALPGQVVLRNERTEPVRRRKAGRETERNTSENPGTEAVGRRAPVGILGGTTTYYRVDDSPLDLARNYNPAALAVHADEIGQEQEAGNTPAATGPESYISKLMLLENAASARKYGSKDPAFVHRTPEALAKSSQARDTPGAGRRSSRLQARRESTTAAEGAPNSPGSAPVPAEIQPTAPARARASTSKKRKRPAGKGRKNGPAAKRQRRHSVQFEAEVDQDMSPLSDKELARLPWNNGKPPVSRVDPRKWVPSFPGRRSQGIDMFPHLMAWAEDEDPAVYQGVEPLDESVNTGIDTRIDDTMGVDIEETMDMEDTEKGDQMDMDEMRLSDIPVDNGDSSDNESLRNQSRRTSSAPTQPVERTTHAPSRSIASSAGEAPRGPPRQDSSILKTPFQAQPSTFTPAGTPIYEGGKHLTRFGRYEKISHRRRRSRMSREYGEEGTQLQSSSPGDRSRPSLKTTTSEFLGNDSTWFQSSPLGGKSLTGAGDTSEALSKPSDMPPKKFVERKPRRRENSRRLKSSSIYDRPTSVEPLWRGGSESGPSTHAGVQPGDEWCSGGTPAAPVEDEPTLPKFLESRHPTEPARLIKGLQNRVPYSSGLWTSSDGPEGVAPEARNPVPERSPLCTSTEDETQEGSDISKEAETYQKEEDPSEVQTSLAEDAGERASTEPSTGASQTPAPSAASSEEEETTENRSNEDEPLSPARKSSQAGASQPGSSGKAASTEAGATPDEWDAIDWQEQMESDAQMAARLAREDAEANGISQSDLEQAIKASLETEIARSTADDDVSAQVQAENDDALDRAREAEEHVEGDGDAEMTDTADLPAGRRSPRMTPAERREWQRRSSLTPWKEVHDDWDERGEPVREEQWTV